MLRTSLPIVVTIVLGGPAGVWLAENPVSSDQQTFRSGVDLVAVDVSARMPHQPILGLTAQDFQLFDNGVLQEIVDVSYGSRPIDITLAVDLRFSSTDVMSSVRQSVSSLVKRFEPQDRIRLILFNSKVARATEFTADADALDRVLREARGGSQITFVDAVSDALAAATPTDRRHLVLFVTDGGNANARREMLLDLGRRSRATLSMILSVTVPASGRITINNATDPRTATLEPLVRETGGIITWTSARDVSRPMHMMVEEFRASYVLHFAPRGVEPGGLHTLKVTVNRPGAYVKHRRAYVR